MNALDVLREGLGVREWAASITPSAYGEKVQREMPEAFDALRRVETVIEEARALLQVMHEERWDLLVANGAVMRDSLADALRELDEQGDTPADSQEDKT